MNNDKRAVATDALETLGMIIDEKAARDAIHLAVEPAIAGCTLKPGDDVELIDGVAKHGENPVGIVDPFLSGKVVKGQRFWLVVYPRQITSLRHVWTHPRFPECPMLGLTVGVTTAKVRSERWLTDYAESLGVTYQGLLSHAESYIEDDEYWCEGGRFEGESLPDDFWDHYEKATGKAVPNEKRWSFFSCSC
jgi:hypothetical protein